MPALSEPYVGPYWYIAGRSRSLRPGQLRSIVVGGKPFMLFRDAAKRACAWEDRCAHRNAPLSRGSFCGEAIVCGYHGWRYALDGQLAHIPARHSTEPLPETRVQVYPCIEQDGYVWICPELNPAQPAPMPFPHCEETGWTTFRMRTRFRAGIEACLENFLDCPHAVYVHRNWFRAPRSYPVRVCVTTLADGAQAEFFDEPREGSVVWSALLLKKGTMRHVDRFIAPHTSRVDYELSSGLHYIITSSCTPVSATETIVHTVISFRLRYLGWLVKWYFRPLARLIIDQDRRMLDAMQGNIDRFDGARVLSTPEDVLGKWIVTWRRALQSETPPPPAGLQSNGVIRL